jgi:ABC-type transport system involved in cytochrome c biogenesis permease subunit
VNIIPLVLYVVAASAYAVSFASRRAGIGRLATAVLTAGVISHTFVIGMQTMAAGHVPVVGASAAISTFVWLLGLAYLSTEMTTEERSMGVFVVPLMVVLQVIPVFLPGVERRAPILESPWFGVHVSSLLFAYASFGLACVLGVTYMLLFKEIKAKHLGFFYARLPSLQVLDAMNFRAVTIGWVFLTLGVVVGVIWAVQARGAAVSDPRLTAMSVYDPKIFVALICWAVYSFQLCARRAMGWSGRRAAWLSAVGFLIVLLNLVPVSYFLTRSHNF